MAREIGVIGTFIRDTIITLDQQKVESIGGLYHALAYLACLAEPDTVIKPLCHVGADFSSTVKHALKRFGNHVSFDLLHKVPQPNTQVTLIYRNSESRDEITTRPMAAITPDEIRQLAGCEAVIVNLITGQDVSLEALHHLKNGNGSPLVYFDLHSLALGIDAEGRRYYRELPDWPSWIEAVDILQMNEKEAATLAGVADPGDEELISFGLRIVGEELTACHITLGSRGSLLFYRDGNRVRHQAFRAEQNLETIDIIGCGDAFGAAFITHFLQHGDFPGATSFANHVAGLNCAFMGSLTPENFRSHVQPYL